MPAAVVKAPLACVLRFCTKKVSVPLVFCVLILVLIISLDLQVHMTCKQCPDGEGPGASVSLVPDRGQESAAHRQAAARVDDLLQNSDDETGPERLPAPQPQPQATQRHQQDQAAPVQTGDQLPQKTVQHQQESNDGEVAALAQILRMRKAEAPAPIGHSGVIGKRTCQALDAAKNVRGACVDTACPHRFDSSPYTPVRQLLSARFRLTEEQQALVSSLARGVQPRKYIFVTAASSNHYNESQALVHNLRRFIWPKLAKDSYIFLYYDLGLKPLERRRVEKNCNCTVMPIDLSLFPVHTRHLMCYAWKTFIIRALLPKAEVLVYMDVSVRFVDLDLGDFFNNTRRWGAQFLASKDAIPNHTVQQTFDFYQAPPCLFWPFTELLAGFSVFHNEPFMTRVVLDSWVACAFSEDCMCPVNPLAYRLCPHTERKVGTCHRFDLSALTIQMAMLYGDKLDHLVMQGRTRPRIVRDDKMAFFTD